LYNNHSQIDDAIDILYSANKIEKIVICADDVKKLWKIFSMNFILLEAAGGAVYNGKNELLMIWRFEKWDLPKGKIEMNETPSVAALREVCEETGVCNAKIVSELPPTYHTYVKNKKHILKKTYWFKMMCTGFTEFKLQADEGIIDAKWMDEDNVLASLKLSHPSISDLITTSLIATLNN
ncbi:MAG: NUDIX hydrolase, partial [Bacteroidia bacterium]